MAGNYVKTIRAKGKNFSDKEIKYKPQTTQRWTVKERWCKWNNIPWSASLSPEELLSVHSVCCWVKTVFLSACGPSWVQSLLSSSFSWDSIIQQEVQAVCMIVEASFITVLHCIKLSSSGKSGTGTGLSLFASLPFNNCCHSRELVDEGTLHYMKVMCAHYRLSWIQTS